MRKNHNSSLHRLILSLVLVFCASTHASLLSFDPEKIPDYDYSQTDWIILYGKNDYVILANPFEHPAPNMGVLVYEMILLYAPQMQEFQGLPEEPTHIMDLTIKDVYDKRRLGQRLFVGDPWISDGKSLALMKPEDYKVLAELLRRRYKRGERYDVKRLENLRRPKTSELPDDWQPEKPSVKVAIENMGVSDYERYGYDPGAAIRRRWDDGHEEIAVENNVKERVLVEESVGAKVEAPALKPPTEVVNKEAPTSPEIHQRDTTTDTARDSQGSTEKPDYDRQIEKEASSRPPFLSVLLMLIGLFFLTLILRRKRKRAPAGAA